jgi:hypothetical protein
VVVGVVKRWLQEVVVGGSGGNASVLMKVEGKEAIGFSAWKSSPKTGKRPRLDWTKTAEDRKFPGPSKTATAVRSSVSNDFGNLKTDKRPV